MKKPMKKSMRSIPLLMLLFSILAVLGLAFCFLRQNDIDNSATAREELTLTAAKLSAAADSFLLVHDGDAILIDAGEQEDGDRILDLLKTQNISHLKALILTHYDKDHIGGAADVLKNVSVDQCYMPCGSEDSDIYDSLMDALDENGCEQIMLTHKSTFSELGGEITIYPALQYSYEKNNDNNRSFIVTVAYEGEELLFAGDAQKERMDEFLENQYDGTSFDFVKIPYHGRGKKTVKAMLDAFTPSCALITSSEEEPADETVKSLLKDAGVDVWYPKDGDVTVKVTYGNISISQDGQSVSYDKKSEEEADTEDLSKEEETDRSETTEEETSDAVKVEAPTFSKDSGFYEDSFDLTIDAPEDTTVYYTLDSSVPTTASEVYANAISITDPSSNPNIYCARSDFIPYTKTALYEGQPEVFPGYYRRYLIPDNPVDKCAVVRAVAVDKNGNCSSVTTASYFIGFDQKEGYENVSVLSIVSDPDGLFSSENGIMVNGSTYEDMLKSGALESTTGQLSDIRDYTNLYAGRGREWEREAHIDYFGEGDLGLIFSQEAGMRLHGNQSRVIRVQKSFNLYAREEYDGNSTFQAPFFDDGILSDTVTLMRGSDIRNYYLCANMNGRDMDTQQYRLVQVFLDGEYWGFYAIQERYSSTQYMKTHYGLDKGDYDLFVGGPTGFRCKKGDEQATKTSFVNLKAYVADHDLSDPQVYEKVCSMLDVQSFIDDYAARIYTGDQDWSWYKNQYLLYYDNKWHYMTYDIDYGAGEHDTAMPEVNTFTSPRYVERLSLSNDPLFPYLMQNEQFRKDFVNTFMDLANDIYSEDRVKKDKDTFLEQYWDATMKSIERYPAQGESLEEDKAQHNSRYAREFDEFEDYFEDRYDYAVVYLKDYFALSGSLAEVTLAVNDVDGGEVQINTITPPLNDEGSWSGKYYTDYPVTVTATASDGWTFVGWKCENGSILDAASVSTEITFSEDTCITAVFEKE